MVRFSKYVIVRFGRFSNKYLKSYFICVGKPRTKHVQSMYQAMLKSIGFKLQVQLIAKKGSQFQSSSTDREIRLDRSRIVEIRFGRSFKQGPISQKRLEFYSNLSTYKRETLATFFRLLEDLCVTFVRSERFCIF